MVHKVLSVAVITSLTSAQNFRYAATFSNNNINGEVVVDNGQVTVDLDLSGRPDLPGGFDECLPLSFHIHEVWNHPDTIDRVEAACGAPYTGGHYDPWNACGPASGNPYCNTSSSTSNYSCIATDPYANADFVADPFSVEVGDWSKKYHTIDINQTLQNSSFYEVMPSELEGFSVVFHCSDGTRAFCAPFIESTDATTEEIPSQLDDETVVAYFDVLSAESMIKLSPDGTVAITLDATSVYDPTNLDFGCAEYEYTIFNAGDAVLSGSALGDACSGFVSDQYDPTRQCLPWSESEYCFEGLLCEDPDYEYNCDFANDRFSCAPGDLSGKFGWFDPVILVTFEEAGPTTLIPPTESLIGKVIAIHCSAEDQPDIEFLACATIEEFSDDGDDSIDGVVVEVSWMIAIIISCIVSMY